MNDIHIETWDMPIQFAQKEQVKDGKKTHLSQARALLSLKEASLIGILFWNRTYPRVRL